MRVELNAAVMISVLCGRERDQWINPRLAERLFQAIADGMASGRTVAVDLIYDVHPVEQARNRAVENFLRSPFQWLLMLDNDVIPPPNFLKIITEAESEGKFLFGVPTPMIGDTGLLWNVAHRQDDVLCAFNLTLPAGWNRCDFLGAAFLAARRPVFETIKSNWFDRLPNKSEDFSFSQRAQDAGFQPWFTGDYRCDHIHSAGLSELMKRAAQDSAKPGDGPGESRA